MRRQNRRRTALQTSEWGLIVFSLCLSACSSAGQDSDQNPNNGLLGSGGNAFVAPGTGGTTTALPPQSAAGQASVLPPVAGAGGTSTVPPATSAAFCDALQVVRARCQGCHGTDRKYGAPMSLVTYADFQAQTPSDASKKVFQQMSVRLHDSLHPMPPTTEPRLAAADLATLDGWIAGGAQAGSDPTCAALPPTTKPPEVTPDPEAFPWPADCEKRYTLTADNGGTKQVVAAGKEAHPQVYITAPWKGPVQALAFRPITDNAKILHHWIMYSPDGAFLTGWAPGSENGRVPLPPDVGQYLPTTGQIRLDLHYNNLGGAGQESDASGAEVCVIETQSKFRANTATVFGGFSALPSIPPNQKVDNVGNCTVNASKGPVHVLTNSPHMHLLGINAKLVLTRGGQQTVLHDAPFSFDDQRSYPFDPQLILQSGDKVTTTCTYQNTTSKTVTFGENTENEMCFNFVLYYPMGGLACSGGFGLPPSL